MLPIQLAPSGLPTDPVRVVELGGLDEPHEFSFAPQVVVGVLPDGAPSELVRRTSGCTVVLSRTPAGDAVVVDDLDAALAELTKAVEAHPVAAVSLHQLLGTQTELPVAGGLAAESALYSALLAGDDFARWRASHPVRHVPDEDDPVRVSRDCDRLLVTLARPARRNAYNRAMRDALIDALTVAAVDETLEVEVAAEGPDFCAGGDLDEFGTARDVAAAHVLRTGRSAALALHAVADRTTVLLKGNCIGAGIELPAFAGRVVADPGTRIRLPELAMGLIPGAGGTVSVTRRIGRRRTAWLALTGAVLTASTALRWGLIDEIRR
jgi:hypothetical protein